MTTYENLRTKKANLQTRIQQIKDLNKEKTLTLNLRRIGQ